MGTRNSESKLGFFDSLPTKICGLCNLFCGGKYLIKEIVQATVPGVFSVADSPEQSIMVNFGKVCLKKSITFPKLVRLNFKITNRIIRTIFMHLLISRLQERNTLIKNGSDELF